MAEEKELKAVEETAETEEEKTKRLAATPVYKYTVTRFANGLYDFEGLPLDAEKDTTPSLDKLGVARDIIDLGRKLDHQLIIEEAVSRAENTVLANLSKLASGNAEAPAVENK